MELLNQLKLQNRLVVHDLVFCTGSGQNDRSYLNKTKYGESYNWLKNRYGKI